VHHNSENGDGTDERTHDGVEDLIIHVTHSRNGLNVGNGSLSTPAVSRAPTLVLPT
jgi:hypothetical protein